MSAVHDSNPENWQRVAEAIKRRRSELGLSRPQVYGAGGPSETTQQNLDQAVGKTYRDDTLASLERVLRWAPGSIRAILDGHEPTAQATDNVIVQFQADESTGQKKITVGLPAAAQNATPDQIEEMALAAKQAAFRVWREMNPE